jgi:hypothetical protein
MNPSAAKQTATANRDNNKLLKITFRFIVSPEVKNKWWPRFSADSSPQRRLLQSRASPGVDIAGRAPGVRGDVEGKMCSPHMASKDELVFREYSWEDGESYRRA